MTLSEQVASGPNQCACGQMNRLSYYQPIEKRPPSNPCPSPSSPSLDPSLSPPHRPLTPQSRRIKKNPANFNSFAWEFVITSCTKLTMRDECLWDVENEWNRKKKDEKRIIFERMWKMVFGLDSRDFPRLKRERALALWILVCTRDCTLIRTRRL